MTIVTRSDSHTVEPPTWPKSENFHLLFRTIFSTRVLRLRSVVLRSTVMLIIMENYALHYTRLLGEMFLFFLFAYHVNRPTSAQTLASVDILLVSVYIRKGKMRNKVNKVMIASAVSDSNHITSDVVDVLSIISSCISSNLDQIINRQACTRAADKH